MSQAGWMNLSLTQCGISWLAGGLSVLSPCVFPLLPMVLGGVLQSHRLGPLAMGAGMALAFAALGVMLGALGPVTGLSSHDVRLLGAALLMMLGLLMVWPRLNERFTQWMTPLATGANAWSSHLQGHGLSHALMLGALLGLVWSPCSGPLLASALVMATSQGGALPGAVLLGFFGLGAATPLVAAAYVSRQHFLTLRQWVLAHADRARYIMGGTIFVTGLAVAAGVDKWFEAQVLAWLPSRWLRTITMF